ncbi:MAG: hypothetical protein EAX89_10575 [Candidatus Lokiarchaeota archaeon]|nr:hypothetical protein [Candidatus Lokiarchaeota archaeon]
MELEKINERLKNEPSNINPLKGYEIICEAMVYKILDIFGKNSLLSMLYQTGAGPGEVIANRIKLNYGKDQFEIIEALEILISELKEFYSIQIQTIEENPEFIRVVLQNHCFLRESIKRRGKLQFGKAFCRVNKGYFETALKKLIGNKMKRIDIRFLRNVPEKDVCLEELIFYL